MSGRPVLPVQWALGSYPGGSDAWSATVKRVANGARVFVPNVDATAQEVNDALGEAFDRLREIIAQTGSMAVNNWHTVDAAFPFQGSNDVSGGVNRLAWDGFNKLIITCGAYGVAPVAGDGTAVSYNGGRTFVNNAIDRHQVTTYAYAANPVNGTHAYCTVDATGGAFAIVPSGVATGNWTLANNVWFTGGNCIVNAGANGATQRLSSISGSTLTDRSAQVPASMLASATDVMFAQSSTTLLVFGDKLAASGGSNYLSTTDGATYTTRTSPVSGSFKVVGAGHDGTYFVVLATDGTDTRVYTSATGTSSWSLVATLSSLQAKGLATVGTCIAATISDGTRCRLYKSVNAGVTWAPCGNWYSSTTTDRLVSVSDGEGLMSWSATKYGASNVGG